MARDRAKNAYYTVGIPLDSDTYRSLKADSKETGVSIPQLLAVRITDWYKFSSGVGMNTGIQMASSSGPFEQASSLQAAPSNQIDLQARAAAAAVAWAGDD